MFVKLLHGCFAYSGQPKIKGDVEKTICSIFAQASPRSRQLRAFAEFTRENRTFERSSARESVEVLM